MLHSLLHNNQIIGSLIITSILSNFIDVFLTYKIRKFIVKFNLKTFVEIFSTSFAATRNIILISFVILLVIGKINII